jgi:sulfate adenylyltransferase subunit 2
MDVWQYIKMEDIPLPSIYFSHEREFVRRNGVLLGRCEHITLLDGEQWESANVRCRTVGDMTCTGVVESIANNVDDIIEEVAAARQTERGGRVDDKRGETAMEDRKKEGYF